MVLDGSATVSPKVLPQAGYQVMATLIPWTLTRPDVQSCRAYTFLPSCLPAWSRIGQLLLMTPLRTGCPQTEGLAIPGQVTDLFSFDLLLFLAHLVAL